MIDKGHTLALSIESALTSHMLTGNYKNKRNIIDQAALLPGIDNLKIIPDEKLTKQFSTIDQSKVTQDSQIARAFSTGQEQYKKPDFMDMNAFLRVSFPYKATSKNNINCMNCHEANEGEVLAVLDFSVDMKNYLGMSLNYLYILFFAFIVVILSIVWFLVIVTNRNVIEPLKSLVEETGKSYQKHIDVDTNRFESMELDYVANKVNQFSHLIIQQNKDLIALNKEIEASQREIIHAMGYIGETRSKETAQRVVRGREEPFLLAQELGLP